MEIKPQPPLVEPIREGVNRPLWSVMIPTYNCASYLLQTLKSVLAQDLGPDQMQIEVVDDCSTEDDPEAIVRDVGKDRVSFYRKDKNAGATENFNTCIRRSRGHLVHILHGDDFVLPGFYSRLNAIAEEHPELSLIATRACFVDEDNNIFYVSERLHNLESGSHDVDRFYYDTPIQTPGVVMRRSFYEGNGGFVPTLVHTADCEMWSRAISIGGGIITSDVLASYRVFANNDSGRLARTGKNLLDLERLNQVLASRFPGFDLTKAHKRVCNLAFAQAERLLAQGDQEGAKINFAYWKANAGLEMRLQKFGIRVAKRILKKKRVPVTQVLN